MKNILIMVMAGAGLFSVTVVGMLAATGRLNHHGTKGIPIVHGFFPAPAEEPPHQDDEPVGAGVDSEPGRTPYGSGGDPVRQSSEPLSQPRSRSLGRGGQDAEQTPELADSGPNQHPREGESAEDSEQRHFMGELFGKGQYRAGELFQFEGLPAGISSDDLNEMWRRARSALEEAEQRMAALDEREKLLAVRERDLHDREEALATKMKDIEASQRQLDARIVQFNDEVKIVRESDEEPLKAAGRTLASMEPEVAAQVVQEWWATEEGQDRALKILSVMEAEAADGIVAVLPVQQMRDFLEKRLLLTRQKR